MGGVVVDVGGSEGERDGGELEVGAEGFATGGDVFVTGAVDGLATVGALSDGGEVTIVWGVFTGAVVVATGCTVGPPMAGGLAGTVAGATEFCGAAEGLATVGGVREGATGGCDMGFAEGVDKVGAVGGVATVGSEIGCEMGFAEGVDTVGAVGIVETVGAGIGAWDGVATVEGVAGPEAGASDGSVIRE